MLIDEWCNWTDGWFMLVDVASNASSGLMGIYDDLTSADAV